MRKFKRGEFALIEWLDACSYDEWEDSSDIDLAPVLIISLGIVYDHTKEYITLALNYDRENELFSTLMCIPSGMIKSIKTLK
jgi:hypothetical protein